MQKISYIHLGTSKTKYYVARSFVFALLLSALSCGHFEGPEYSSDHDYQGQGEYSAQGENSTPDEFSSPDELYKSDDVLKNPQRPIHKGPFKLQWPTRKIDITRGFSEGGRKAHLGLDIRGRKGDQILAAHDGVVVYAGSGFRGFGKMIILEYDSAWATLYGHLSRFRCKTGQQVRVGEIIGEMGRTGRATGVHLHFELMRNKTPIDPQPLLGQRGDVVGNF